MWGIFSTDVNFITLSHRESILLGELFIDQRKEVERASHSYLLIHLAR